MKAATTVEMRQIDAAVINEYGLPGTVLMENAGAAVSQVVEAQLHQTGGNRVCIVAGKGNNGGDGLVAARRLKNCGFNVQVCLVAKVNALSVDAQIQFKVLRKMGIDIHELSNERDWDQAGVTISLADCLVDAILGTGIRSGLDERIVAIIKLMNDSGRPIVAIDLPTGIAADTGCVEEVAIRADKTVALGLPKPGLYLYPGADYVGELIYTDLGIPQTLLTSPQIQQNIITHDLAKSLLPVRPADAYKGSCGRVGVIAGSSGLSGAAVLAANGAMRSGAGLVTVGSVISLQPVLAMKLTEAMTCGWPETDQASLSSAAIYAMLELDNNSDVTLIGPGLGRHEETQVVIRQLIQTAQRPLVIDADALRALAADIAIIKQTEALAVVTPHLGEMAALTGLELDYIKHNRLAVARKASVEWGCVVVLKGAGTIVAYPDGEVYINTTGNAGLATGGTGDVLAGVIAGFIAQGMSSQAAAVASVYVHGLAADLVAADCGMIGLTAGDVNKTIPVAINSLMTKHKFCRNVTY